MRFLRIDLIIQRVSFPAFTSFTIVNWHRTENSASFVQWALACRSGIDRQLRILITLLVSLVHDIEINFSPFQSSDYHHDVWTVWWNCLKIQKKKKTLGGIMKKTKHFNVESVGSWPISEVQFKWTKLGALKSKHTYKHVVIEVSGDLSMTRRLLSWISWFKCSKSCVCLSSYIDLTTRSLIFARMISVGEIFITTLRNVNQIARWRYFVMETCVTQCCRVSYLLFFLHSGSEVLSLDESRVFVT